MDEQVKKESREAFYQQVYQVVRDIPAGRVATYGQIAFLIGRPDCPRMVGQAMRHAPAALHLPCHRVVNAQGRLAPGWDEQKFLLISEGVGFKRNGCVDLKHYRWALF